MIIVQAVMRPMAHSPSRSRRALLEEVELTWGSGALNARPWPVLTVMAVIGFYIELDINALGGILPNVLAAPFGFVLLLLHWRRVTRGAAASLAALALLYLVSCLVAVQMAPGGDVRMLQPVGQFLYSALTAYGVYLDLTLWRRSDVHKLFGWLTGGILVGAFLETYTPFKALADAVHPIHTLVRRNGSESVTMFRDLTLYGRPRARLFTSEASYVGTNFALFAAIWMLTAPALTPRRVLIAGAAVLAGLVIIRSPFCILPVFLVGADVVFNRQRNRHRLAFTAFGVMLFLTVSVVGLLAAGLVFTSIFAKRLQGAPDWSMVARTYGAIAAGWNVALKHPLLGAGAGNFDGFRDTVVDTYHGLGVPDYVLMGEMLSRSLNNGIGATLAFFGLVGGALYLALQVLLGRSLTPVARGSFILTTLLLTYFMAGGIYSPKGVWPMFLILGAMAAGSQSVLSAARAAPQREPESHARAAAISGAV